MPISRARRAARVMTLVEQPSVRATAITVDVTARVSLLQCDSIYLGVSILNGTFANCIPLKSSVTMAQ